MKYIIDELNMFVIFPNHINHDDMARLHCKPIGCSIVGAGFIEIFDGIVSCYGESVSLRIKSRGHIDSEIIAYALDLKTDPVD